MECLEIIYLLNKRMPIVIGLEKMKLYLHAYWLVMCKYRKKVTHCLLCVNYSENILITHNTFH